MRILVADDEPTTCLIAQAALDDLGHDCLTVPDGARAWDAYRSERPDVVISDWMMPGLTGPQLCRNIRRQPAGDYAYFIMLSVNGTSDDIFQGMTAGADDYLVKPLDIDDLEARLVVAARVSALHTELAQQRTELDGLTQDLASIVRRDPLTGVGNRLALQEDLELLDEQLKRYGDGYCLALLEVDLFKSYNDTYGRQAGDVALHAVAVQLSQQARSGDTIYRYGGEEFLCIFPEQSMATGALAVERMRTAVERLAVLHVNNPRGVLTISAGLALQDPGAPRPPGRVFKEADDGLYRAKKLGRNRVEHLGPGPS
jgi:two-component system chemotaxis response regulator CheY